MGFVHLHPDPDGRRAAGRARYPLYRPARHGLSEAGGPSGRDAPLFRHALVPPHTRCGLWLGRGGDPAARRLYFRPCARHGKRADTGRKRYRRTQRLAWGLAVEPQPPPPRGLHDWRCGPRRHRDQHVSCAPPARALLWGVHAHRAGQPCGRHGRRGAGAGAQARAHPLRAVLLARGGRGWLL